MLGEYQNKQPIIYNILSNEINNNTVKHAYLFDVSSIHDEMDFVNSFAKSLLCPYRKLMKNDCGDWHICQKIDDNSFPDIVYIEQDGITIKKEQLVNLQSEFKTKSLYNNKKIYVIRYAENLNLSAANSILKFLEEPEENIIAILLTKNINNVIKTILSRCEILKLLPDGSGSSILSLISDNIEEYESYFEEENLKTLCEKVITFVEYYENYGVDVLAHSTKYWFDTFTDKKLNTIGYTLLLLYYKDTLNIKLGRKIEIYKDHIDSLNKIGSKNDIEKLYKKIYLIVEAIDRNKLNINLSLNFDNLIIRMED